MKRFHHKKKLIKQIYSSSIHWLRVLFIAQFNFFTERTFEPPLPTLMPATAKSHFKLWDYVSLMKVLVFKIESDVEISGHICSISDRYLLRLQYKMNFLMVHIHFSLLFPRIMFRWYFNQKVFSKRRFYNTVNFSEHVKQILEESWESLATKTKKLLQREFQRMISD